MCIEIENICLTDQDCLRYGHAICDKGICTRKIFGGCPVGMVIGNSNICRKIICQLQSDCKNNLSCRLSSDDGYGICVENSTYVPPSKKCQNGQIKITGECTPLECTHHGHCPTKHFCIMGVCNERIPECELSTFRYSLNVVNQLYQIVKSWINFECIDNNLLITLATLRIHF